MGFVAGRENVAETGMGSERMETLLGGGKTLCKIWSESGCGREESELSFNVSEAHKYSSLSKERSDSINIVESSEISAARDT